MSICQWPADSRPREKLLKRGARALSDAELLAIFLRVGVAGKSAIELAGELLLRFGSLHRLVDASSGELCSIKGVGTAKYAQLQAVLELARRTLEEDLAQRDVLSSPAQVRDYLLASMRTRSYEVFVCLFLDTRNQIIACEEMFRGTVNQTSVHPREVTRRALLLNASGLIVAHNHPSGAADVSAADERLTRQLKSALSLVDIVLLDHLIVAGARVVSLAEHGLL